MSGLTNGSVTDSLDPHGFQGGHEHGHVIVRVSLLRGVLLALAAFTILTVAASRGEIWFSHTFDVVIPQWVNVIIAMSIAVIKATLVVLFFMQLKYENKLNAVFLCSCLFLFGLFLFLTMGDLGTRDRIYRWQSQAVVPGGTMVGLSLNERNRDKPAGESLVTWARKKYVSEHGLEDWAEHMSEHLAEHHQAWPPHLLGWLRDEYVTTYGAQAWSAWVEENILAEEAPSSAQWSRPRHGLTRGLFNTGPWTASHEGQEQAGAEED